MPDSILSFGAANVSQGRLFWRGVWSSLVTYNPNDAVAYNGSAYIALAGSLNVLPTVTTSWGVMVSSGSVTSVAGRVGVITLSSSDLTDKDSPSGVAGLDASGFLKASEATTNVNAQVGTTYTIVSGDRGKLVTLTNASSVAVTVPAASGSFAAGFFCEVSNLGAGVVTLTPTGTIDGAASLTLKQFQSITLTSVGGNWVCLRSRPALPVTSAVSHQFVTAVAADGSVTQAQPAFSDISGTVAASQLPNPSASTLGGVESISAVTSKWINAISTSGVPSATQPSITDLAVGTSANLASILSDETGTGSAVFATSPALVTPSIGIATAQRLVVSQGTALTTGKVGSLTGFGSTASVSSVVGKDGLFVVNISCSGTGQATNASFVLTFADAAYALAPIAICCRGDGNAPSGAFIFATTTTTIQVAIAGTPVAGNIYSFQVFVPGR
jgi:hypothetical protein